MGWLADLFRDIPLSGIQQENIAAAEAKYGATEAEKADLKDDLRQAKAEITKLRKQVQEFTDKDLDPADVAILRVIAIKGSASVDVIAHQLQIHNVVCQLQVNALSRNCYIRGEQDSYGFQHYRLCDKARRYLIANNLLPPSPQIG